MQVDYYELLEVTRGCDEKTLKTAFRRLAMQYHPDRNPGDKDAEHKFKEINKAYDVLKDPQKRAAYDRYGHEAFEGASSMGGNPFGAGFSGMGGGFANIFEDIFGEMMGAGARKRSAHRRGDDLSYNVQISLEEAFSGKTIEIDLPTKITCRTCKGSGKTEKSKVVTCSACYGSGKIRTTQGFFAIESTCAACQGRGETMTNPCQECHGQGRIAHKRTLSVNIPAGVDHGMRIRLSGEGEAGERGAPAGDLYLLISIKRHALFTREGANLFYHVPLSMTTAALGGTVQISTLDKSATELKIPAGTQNGKRFVLKNKGMPLLRSSSFGDLHVEVEVETPRNLSKKQRELLQEFEKTSKPENSPQSHGFFSKMKEIFENFSQP